MIKLLQHSCQELATFSKLTRIVTVGRYSSSAAASASSSPVEQHPADSSSASADQREERTPEVVQDPVITGSSSQRKSGFVSEQEANFTPFRYVYPEFLPDVNIKWRNRIREKLERMDMLKRRSNFEIPEFYVGSILSVTVSDRHAPGKTNTFVGICIVREASGLASTFTLRNVVDGHGVEICFELYNPTIVNITCLRLEKRLDDNLRYLRDAPPEYSTFPFDMVPELRSADAPVPINPIKVKLNPKPWTCKWHLWHLKGIEDITDQLEPWQIKKYNLWKFQTGYESQEYDLMKTYRSTIPADEQTEIYSEVHQQLQKLTASLRKLKKKRVFVKPQKTV